MVHRVLGKMQNSSLAPRCTIRINQKSARHTQSPATSTAIRVKKRWGYGTHELCANAGFARLREVSRSLPHAVFVSVAIRAFTPGRREESQSRLEHVGNEGQGSQVPQQVLEQLYSVRRRSLGVCKPSFISPRVQSC